MSCKAYKIIPIMRDYLAYRAISILDLSGSFIVYSSLNLLENTHAWNLSEFHEIADGIGN